MIAPQEFRSFPPMDANAVTVSSPMLVLYMLASAGSVASEELGKKQMSDGDNARGGVPAVSHGGKGFSIDIAGIPIPLRRTFGAIDRLIATPIEALADSMERKIKRNLDSHVDAVVTKRKAKGKKEKIADPSVRTTKRIAEWAAAASEVEPEEQELSAIWRAVLDEILEEKDDAEELLLLVKSVPAFDIRFFLEFFSISPLNAVAASTLEGGGRVERLKGYGLLRRATGLPAVWVMLIAFLFSAYAYVFGQHPHIVLDMSQPVALPSTITFVGFATVFAIAFVLFANMFVPTSLGKRLSRLYKEYLKKDKDAGKKG